MVDARESNNPAFTDKIAAKKNTSSECRRSESPSSPKNYHLPSPLSSLKCRGPASPAPKRKRVLDESILSGQERSVKRRLFAEDRRNALDREEYDPITYWVFNKNWPQDFAQRGRMAELSGTKRRSDSTHRSVYMQRLEEQGVYIRASSQIQKASKILCRQLLEGGRAPPKFTSFPFEQFPKVLQRVQALNESRIQRDITPWIVPSAETLHFCGEPDLECIGDEMNAKWTRCATLGGKVPQPDYVAGLLPSAFTKEERERLSNYSSPVRPFFFTPELCYPFLVCEVKTGERGMGEADRQNIHSASIAVRAIIELYRAAYEASQPEKVRELYGKILVFSVSHNHNSASLHGHFAILAESSPDSLEYYRHDIALVSLSIDESAACLTVHGFIRNLYDKFAKEHVQRIKEATAALPKPVVRSGLSFSASDLALSQSDSQQDSQEDPPQLAFEMPTLPASATKLFEQQKMLMDKRLEQQRLESKQREERLETQIEQQKLESKQREDRLENQMEQQRQQMEQQRQQMEQQRQQMEEVIRLLRKSQS